MKETYCVTTPRKLVFGDPWYFEQYSGEKLARLVVDLEPPAHFAARVVLEEKPFESGAFENEFFEDDPEFMMRTMTIFLAPKATIETYMKDMIYESQEEVQKSIGVDTARYYLRIDDCDETIHTGGDGCWGDYLELRRTSPSGQPILDAAIVTVVMSEYETMESMWERLNYFFADVTLTENIEPSEHDLQGNEQPQQSEMQGHL